MTWAEIVQRFLGGTGSKTDAKNRLLLVLQDDRLGLTPEKKEALLPFVTVLDGPQHELSYHLVGAAEVDNPNRLKIQDDQGSSPLLRHHALDSRPDNSSGVPGDQVALVESRDRDRRPAV